MPKRIRGHRGLHQIYRQATKKNKLGILGVHVQERWRVRKGGTRYRVREAVAQLRIKGIASLRQHFPYRNALEKRRAIDQATMARLRFERKRDRLIKEAPRGARTR